MELTPLAAYDTLRFTLQLDERLRAAQERLSSEKGLANEKRWLDDAETLLNPIVTALPSVLDAARHLPELDDVRGDYVDALQARYADALEKLVAGITFHAGGRAPILEALFPNVKLTSAQRKAAFPAVASFFAELERRLSTAYVTRIMKEPEMAFAPPVVAALKEAFHALEACFSTTALPESVAQKARAELLALGEEAGLRAQQVRLLAQAALLPLDGAFEASGLGQKPRKSRTRDVADRAGGEDQAA
jgi:hypothetical protein